MRNFYSHAPYGTCPAVFLIYALGIKFLLTRPLGYVTKLRRTLFSISQFLLTRPLRDVTLGNAHYYYNGDISTHTPLTGRDVEQALQYMGIQISTHTPLTGPDHTEWTWPRKTYQFLLTRPLRDVTRKSD